MSEKSTDKVLINVEGKNINTGGQTQVKKELSLDDLKITGGETVDPMAKMKEIMEDTSLTEDEKFAKMDECAREATARQIDEQNTAGRIMGAVKAYLKDEGIEVDVEELTMTQETQDGVTTYSIMPQAAWGVGVAA